jgi:hypothetical protein
MTSTLEEISVADLRELLVDTEQALFGLEFCVCEGCLATPPAQTAAWIDDVLALRAKIHVELRRRGEWETPL